MTSQETQLASGVGGRGVLLQVRDLRVTFGRDNYAFEAVRGISFDVGRGEIFGVVGESGSGKSVMSLALMNLLDPRSARVSGSAVLDGAEVLMDDERKASKFRGRDVGMIFQEPMTALDPVFKIGHQITETIRTHESVSRRAAKQRAIELLASVGIADPAQRLDAYPHQLSGGMRQRVMIAIAISCGPRVLFADEPTTALDVTVQAQVLDVLKRLRDERDTSIVLITHDVAVVAETCDRVTTMYAGELVESGDVAAVIDRPLHPYTAGLLAAIPNIHTRGKRLATIPGRVPGPHDRVAGCVFRDRCGFAEDQCAEPQHLYAAHPGHLTQCGRALEIEPRLVRT